MQCRACGADVRDSDRFCNACGTSLAPDADATEPAPAATGSATTEPSTETPVEPSMESSTRAPRDGHDTPEPSETGGTAPDQRETTATPETQRRPATPDERAATDRPPPPPAPNLPPPASSDPPGTTMPAAQPYDDADPQVTYELAALAGGDASPSNPDTGRAATHSSTPPDASTGATSAPAVSSAPPPPPNLSSTATTTMGTVGAADSSTTARGSAISATATGQVPATYAPVSTGYDAPDGYDDDRRFRFRLVVVAAIMAAGLAVATGIADIITIETTTDAPLFDIGTWRLNDFGTNNTVAALIAGGLMVLGGLLACFTLRWGGGLAGGAGLALAGWSALVIGQAEIPLAQASAGTNQPQSEQFAVTLTRDTGYWLVVAAGAAGVLVFLLSLSVARRDQGAGLNPWVAALGAAATLVAVAGPVLPQNDATLEDNWTSANAGIDLPTMFFAGRAGQLGVLALTGVIGFLMVRRYGLGLAVGGFSIVAWLALTSLLEQTDRPIGPAVANPGAANYPFPVPAADFDLMPHAATIGGIAVALACAVIATIGVALQRRSDT
ncbi:MAG: hypothetical protein H0X61_03660 [Acidimicrobiia bacterium]|nr:hypothetical protein [Acidimicrobiia bacterium]